MKCVHSEGEMELYTRLNAPPFLLNKVSRFANNGVNQFLDDVRSTSSKVVDYGRKIRLEIRTRTVSPVVTLRAARACSQCGRRQGVLETAPRCACDSIHGALPGTDNYLLRFKASHTIHLLKLCISAHLGFASDTWSGLAGLSGLRTPRYAFATSSSSSAIHCGAQT